MNKIARHRIPVLLALSAVLLTFALVACGGGEETREDVPTATAAAEPASETTPTARASGSTPAASPPHSDVCCR